MNVLDFLNKYPVIISLAALVVSAISALLAGFALFLNRKDKKAVLKIKVEKKPYIYSDSTDENGFFINKTEITEYLVISNPTEKDNFLVRIDFVEARKKQFEVRSYSPPERIESKSHIEFVLWDLVI